MGKTSKWFRSFLTGKKERSKEKVNQSECGRFTSSTSPGPGTPKEKRRWSFRRSSATGPPQSSVFSIKGSSPPPQQPPPPPPPPPPQQQPVVVPIDKEDEESENVSEAEITANVEEFAAVKIQACFRSHLARKALRALKGIVKLQALVRGHLVRKQATATLRCMQALITLQAKAREQRIRMIGDPRTSIHKTRISNIYHEYEESIKIVEMDDIPSRIYSPAASALTEMSPRAYSSHFEDCISFNTAQSSPQCSRFKEYYNGDNLSSYDYPLYPNYMATTQSSKAKARSQSAPKQRPPEIFEKQSGGRRRSSMEAPRNGVPRAVRMQRSSSQLGSTPIKESQQYYPWMAVKLDRSNVSLIESECGSTSTVMTNTNYGRHVDVQGNIY